MKTSEVSQSTDESQNKERPNKTLLLGLYFNILDDAIKYY